jgi:NitT/TauT family transport system substrate-binding protein
MKRKGMVERPLGRVVLLLLVGILPAVVLVTGCGPEPTPTAVPLERVSLQLQWVTQAQFAGYYVALDKGWYEEEGIDLTISPGGPDLVAVDLVTAGTHDFGTSLLADLAVAVQGGKPAVSLAQIQQTNGLLLVAYRDSGIEEPVDFVGKRVGVWLGGWEAQFKALMVKEGIPPGDYELVSQGFSMDPFLAGDLDVASAMIYNEYYVVLESGVSPEALNIIDYADYGLDFPGDTFFTSRRLLESNPDLCTRMLRASLRGWQYAVENPEEAAGIVLKYDETGLQTRDHQLSMMNEIAKLVSLPVRPLGYTDRDDVRRTIDTLLSYGVLAGPVQPDDLFTNEIWEQASAETE